MLRLLQRLPVDGHSYYQKPEIEANVNEMITYLDLGYPRCARCAGPMHVSIVVGKLLEFLAVSIRHFAGFHFSFRKGFPGPVQQILSTADLSGVTADEDKMHPSGRRT